MSDRPTIVASWLSDAALRELLEQAGWRLRVIAERDGRQIERGTMREVYLEAFKRKAK
jgi:8-oxo-dGTP pyrophosphatase MutT (NUDIX family)